MLAADYQRLVIAASLPGHSSASVLLSFGALLTGTEIIHRSNDGTPSSATLSFPLQIFIIRSEPSTKSDPSSSASRTLTMAFHIPSAHVDVPKPLLDALQSWADDVSGLVDQVFRDPQGEPDSEAERKSASLIGSLLSAKSKSKRGEANDNSGESRKMSRTEVVIKATVAEGSLMLPTLHKLC